MSYLQEGKQRLFELGKFLRNRYSSNLLKNRTYSPDLIYVRSSQMQRTMESATAAMSGFFGHDKWNDTIKSIPVNVVYTNKDNLLYFLGIPCARYDDEFNKVINSTEPAALKKYEKLFKYLAEHTGQPVKNFPQLYEIYDTLFIEKSRNLR